MQEEQIKNFQRVFDQIIPDSQSNVSTAIETNSSPPQLQNEPILVNIVTKVEKSPTLSRKSR